MTHKKWLYDGGGGTNSLGYPSTGVGASGLVFIFCHPEVVKLQQQCHMQNTIFDLPQATGSIHFFLGEGECQYPDSNRRIGRKNENDNPVRKWHICSSIITSMFAFLMALGHSGFRHGKTLQKGCFYIVVTQGNSGNKVEKW